MRRTEAGVTLRPLHLSCLNIFHGSRVALSFTRDVHGEPFDGSSRRWFTSVDVKSQRVSDRSDEYFTVSVAVAWYKCATLVMKLRHVTNLGALIILTGHCADSTEVDHSERIIFRTYKTT